MSAIDEFILVKVLKFLDEIYPDGLAEKTIIERAGEDRKEDVQKCLDYLLNQDYVIKTIHPNGFDVYRLHTKGAYLVDLFQKHCFAGDQYYKEGDYEKAIREWETAKWIYVGAGYPYDRLPKAYRKLATSYFKQGDYKVALKWYKELESLIREAKQLIKEGKALSTALWNLKLGSRDEKQINAIYLKLGIQK